MWAAHLPTHIQQDSQTSFASSSSGVPEGSPPGGGQVQPPHPRQHGAARLDARAGGMLRSAPRQRGHRGGPRGGAVEARRAGAPPLRHAAAGVMVHLVSSQKVVFLSLEIARQ